MYKIYCLNNISPEGLALLTDNYEVTENIDEADAILVRSADMHEMEVPANLKAVARAGRWREQHPAGQVRRGWHRRLQHARCQCQRREGACAGRHAAGEPRHHRRRGVGARQRR